MPSANIPAAKDNARSTLSAGISASTLSIPLATGEGSRFPQPYNGTATSLGSSVLLNCTGISATIGGSAAVGKPIFNATDGSIAFIKSVATNAVTTTPLLGGTDNTWQNSDTWRIDEFVVTFEDITTNAYGVDTVNAQEEALVIGRSSDTLTVLFGGRGYNITVAQTFDAGDHVRLLVTSPNHQRIVDYAYELAKQIETDSNFITNLGSTSNGKGASTVAIEDAGGNYTSTNVEGALGEIDTRLDAAITLAGIGFYGDGSDGAPDWSAGASLNPSTEKRYTTATVPVSQTITPSSVNTQLVIHNSSHVIINGVVDMDGKGGAGGNAGAASGGDGTAGTNGNAFITAAAYPQTLFRTNPGSPGAGNLGAGGGGGASAFTAGSNASAVGTPGTGGAVMNSLGLAFVANIHRAAVCGAGGAGGEGGGTGKTGGAGGAGGGALVWMIGGNLTLAATATIRCRGSAGSNGTNGDGSQRGGGGGGGGGGGMIIILVAGTITDNGATLQASGGAGGTGGTDGGAGGGGNGGAGGAGNILIYSLSTGTLITA